MLVHFYAIFNVDEFVCFFHHQSVVNKTEDT